MNLDSYRKLDVNNTRVNYHGVLLDATLLSKVFLKLTTGKQEKLDLIDNKLGHNNNGKNNQSKKGFLTPRYQLMSLSDSEKEQHESFIAEMNDPLWKRAK